MGASRLVSWGLLVGGLASLAYAGLQGDLEILIVVVVPVVAGSGPWAALGMLATILGLAGLLWTHATSPSRPPPTEHPRRQAQNSVARGDEQRRQPGAEDTRESRGGGVILIGPIPIAWGSDPSALGWVLVAAIVLTVVAIALTWTLRV